MITMTSFRSLAVVSLALVLHISASVLPTSRPFQGVFEKRQATTDSAGKTPPLHEFKK